MRYLVLSRASVEYGEAISRALWALRRPEHVRDPADVTTMWGPVLAHPGGGAVALAIPGDLRVHPEAPDTDLPDLVAAAITREERTRMVDDIRAVRGAAADPIALLPGSLAENVRTHAELEVDGWFPAPEGRR